MTIPTENLVLLAAIAGGTFFSAWIMSRRTIARAKQESRNIIDLARKEGELYERELKAKADFELEKKKLNDDREYTQKKTELTELQKTIEKENRDLILERNTLRRRAMEIGEKRDKVEAAAERYRTKLEALTGLSRDEALEQLKAEIRVESRDDIEELRKQILLEAEEDIRQEGQRVIIDSIQRIASAAPSEMSATIVKLPNEEMKGRIIGREGRNIHTFEAVTGTTLMIDETPESVMISSFDPIRRQIACKALEALVKDGRIHPASIEESVERAAEETKKNVHEIGDKAVRELKIKAMDYEIVKLLGRLHFYLSNNQRTLDHSIEVAYICSLMASEIGLNPDIAKRAGLLHDIGKAISHEYEGAHSNAGAQVLRAHGELPVVVNAVEASHGDVEPSSPYAALVIAADALSSTRPGVRTESIDGYIERIRNLETLALSFEGVREAYALRAGREIRIIVSPDKVSDQQSLALSRKIRQRVENELNYPGSIKIIVIREQRFTETAT